MLTKEDDIEKEIKKTTKFKTTIHFKNGSKETVFHDEVPTPDGVMRLMHFSVGGNEFVGFNIDEVRKFEAVGL